ncbi:MAG: CRISPR-associated endonuclease Cas1 [Desulfobia sp.]
MKIYVTTQGARIIKEGRHLLVKKGEDTYNTLFVQKLDQVAVFGSVEITAAARRMLFKNNIDTVFLSKDGRYLGRFASPESKNFALRHKQFVLLDDQEFGLVLCRQLVRGKLTNMMTLLKRIKRTRNKKEAGRKAGEIKALLDAVDKAESIESLRGYEGRGSAIYFSALPLGFLQDHGFHRRVRRPPTDPVNAVLSLLYTFLFNRVYAAVRLNNLDPYPSFLHSPDYGRHSLVMDLMEEFRVIVVDSLVLSLFNLKILREDDFQLVRPPEAVDKKKEEAPDVSRDLYGHISDTESKELFDLPPQRMTEEAVDEAEEGGGKPPVRLVPAALRRVIENFERKLTTEFHYEPYDRKITYAEALRAQAGQYRKRVEGDIKIYEPLLLK